MSTDPRLIRTMLQLHWQPSLSLGSPSSGGSGTQSLFNTLLEQLLHASPAADRTGAPNAVTQPMPSTLQTLGSWPGRTGALEDSFNVVEAQLLAPAAGYESVINEAAAKFDVDPSLIKAVIHTESSFRSDAVSSAGAKGLMQLMDATSQGLGVTNPFDPVQNIEGGTRFLAYLLRKYDGNELTALAAYNAGPGKIDRLGIKTDEDVMNGFHRLPKETQAYISKVTDARMMYS
ncbi:lytic transglycosylase domain-containing protein [Paenibacillus tarimensis]